VKITHLLDVLSDGDLFTVDSILVRLVEISLLSDLLPGRNGLLGAMLSYLELYFEVRDLFLKFCILVSTVSYQSNSYIVEGSFLLKVMPFTVECVQGLCHFAMGEEISNEVIDNNVLIDGCCFWLLD
jgi:hypothetical protein